MKKNKVIKNGKSVPKGTTSGKSQSNVVASRMDTGYHRHDTGQPRGGYAFAPRPVNLRRK